MATASGAKFGFDASIYSRVIDIYEARDKARRKHLEEEQLKRLEQKKISKVTDQDEVKDGGEVGIRPNF